MNQSSDHYEEDDYNKSGSLKTWNKDATECLLELYKQYKTLFAHHKSISVFEFLSLKLLQNNAISKKAIDIQRKFNNLTRTYKNCSKGASKQHQRFQYFDSMHEILNSPPSSISLQEKDSMEQEFQEFEMRQNKGLLFKIRTAICQSI